MTTFNQYLGNTMLNEAVLTEGSSILPAGRVLFNKNKVTPNHAASKEAGVWGEGDQSVRTYAHAEDKWGKDGKRSTVVKHFHVSSHGHYNPDSKHEKKIGERESFQHDQTQKRMPTGELVGVSNYTNGKKVAHHGEDHSNTAASFHVYK
jgi:hypothetical protein